MDCEQGRSAFPPGHRQKKREGFGKYVLEEYQTAAAEDVFGPNLLPIQTQDGTELIGLNWL